MSEQQLRDGIVEVGRRLDARGYVASNDGNISVRLDEARILTTPKSVSKGFMTPEMMVVTDLAGKKISGRARSFLRAADAPRGVSQPARRAAPWCTRIHRSPPGLPSPASRSIARCSLR